MKTIKYIIFAVLCTTSVASGWSQDDKETKRVETEKNTKPFGLNYFTSAENRFYVLEVAVIDKQVVIDTTATIQEVPGKLPYPSGSFNVSVIGPNNEVIVDYNMLDPLLQRSCEEGNGNLGYMDNGRISISIPKIKDITRLILRRDKEEISNLDIADLIKEIPREDPDKN